LQEWREGAAMVVLLRKSGVAVMVFCGGDGGPFFFFRNGGYGFRCCSKACSHSRKKMMQGVDVERWF